MKLNSVLIAILVFPLALYAKCAPIDLTTEVKTTPIFAMVIIKASTPLSDLDACIERQHNKSLDEQMLQCQYSFSAEVKEVLKGKVIEKELYFKYDYWNGCPATYTFNVGEEYLLAIESIEVGGVAKLHSTACGLGGISIREEEQIMNLKRLISENK